MSNIQQRIEQWEKMVRESPDGMAYFSLGNAYRDAERLDEAATAFTEAIKLDEGLSRAYQLLGQTLIQLDRNGEAGPMLTQGYAVATQRGDIMPQKAIGSLLQKLGLPLPQVKTEQAEVPTGENQIIDRRTGKPGTRMSDAPIRGPVGKFIADHYSLETWREWIRQGTKVINELRLDFSRDDHQAMYDLHMLEWLGVSREEIDAYAKTCEVK
ncbi:MAG: Fe(2+)-trafficking protein [Phycisphaeraceae bacterium]|nr:Fe(2+)-trafficking protein [Phycisphaeraceae bacterium]